MVLCCFDSNAANTAEESTYSTTQYGGGAYPGNRLLVKTAGNALMEAPIQSPGTSDLVVAGKNKPVEQWNIAIIHFQSCHSCYPCLMNSHQ
mmetsp:Transcript_31755/g.74330  ORF Transcript_31755/g.74330 Transcript_31755/m.74330 type:complete len:91 (-) Transcript_31755:1739-2011(-)